MSSAGSFKDRMLPRGLYGRAALILIVPVIALQLVVSVVFIQRLYEDVTRQMSRGVEDELRYLLRELQAAPTPEAARDRTAELLAELDFTMELPGPVPQSDRRRFYDLSGRVVLDTLHADIPAITGIDLSDTREVKLGLTTRHGPARLVFDRHRVSASNPHQLLVWMVFTGLLMTFIAFVFLRNQLRPIKRLAQAAEAFGKGRSVRYRPTGALEVRGAGNAFLDMRARIERQIEQRTRMLSGVSHDLRTPLTRLKLGLSMCDEDDAEIAAMRRDVADMERMLDGFLAFAQGDALDEPVPTDPAALAAQVVANAQRAGHAVTFCGPAESERVPLRADAVTRAVDNLVANATRYADQCRVHAETTARFVRIVVEDDGPGIPADRRDEALKPFTRLDPARNQDRGTGVGLGLSTAADIARRHGGHLRLGKSAALGGLKAELVLGRSPKLG